MKDLNKIISEIVAILEENGVTATEKCTANRLAIMCMTLSELRHADRSCMGGDSESSISRTIRRFHKRRSIEAIKAAETTKEVASIFRISPFSDCEVKDAMIEKMWQLLNTDDVKIHIDEVIVENTDSEYIKKAMIAASDKRSKCALPQLLDHEPGIPKRFSTAKNDKCED